MAKFATHMGDPHGDPQTRPQHADPRGLGAFIKKTMQDIHVDRPVVAWSAGRHAQKKPHVRNFSARNSGAGNECANFVGAWQFLVLSAGNPPFLVLGRGGGSWFFLEGGCGSANFIYMGVGILRHVDHICGWQISPWPARKVTE